MDLSWACPWDFKHEFRVYEKTLAEIHSVLSVVPTQAYAFLGAVVCFLILLLVFFLYLNKKLCFANCGGFPCIDKPGQKRDAKQQRLGAAYAYEDAETSSDSDDEVLRRYQKSIRDGQDTVRRVSSERSLRSGRSHATSKGHYNEALDAEDPDGMLGEPGDDTASEAAASVVPPSDYIRRHTDVRTRDEVAQSLAAGSVPSHLGSIERLSHRPAEGATDENTFTNAGFAEEDAEASPQHQSGTSSEKALSQYAETASLSVGDMEQDEHLFDVSDLQDREPALISKCGNLEVTFNYDVDGKRMNITVHQAREIPTKERGGANNSQVRLLLLPTKKVRHKTKIKAGENPEFNEQFQMKVPLEEVNNMGVRFRLYGCERMRRERMIGEAVIGFASLNLDTETTHMLTLEPRSNLSHGDSKLDVSSLSRSDSASSTQSMQHGGMPELLIGLAYNGTTGRLSVEVIKGSNFRNMAMNRAPDTYVKLTLMSPNGEEIARSKTSLRRGQPNPLYKETFMFQVALFQLPDVTLMTSVYNKRSMKRKEMIGWFSLGLNNSGEEELSHWNDMRESKGEQVCRWHVLLES